MWERKARISSLITALRSSGPAIFEDLREMAREEMEIAEDLIPLKEKEIKFLLVPADPEDSKNAILEIRAGTGGDEASIFAGDLFRMYSKYCEIKGWRLEVTNLNEGTSGGYKEIVATISGENVYGVMKYESGVHRVQRVPQTETQGRVHTSAATVAVLPEAEEFDIDLKDADYIEKILIALVGPIFNIIIGLFFLLINYFLSIKIK